MTLDILAYLEQRFGIQKSHFKEFRLYSDRKGRFILGPRGIPLDMAISLGMQIAHKNGDLKPSTNFLQLFGKHVSKNFVSLAKVQAQSYMKGQDLELEISPKTASDGYILLRYMGSPLACGLLKGNKVKNVLPKPRRSEVKFL
jgi:NOL1/NOP2/fmu family ribosome biogenesis protein